MRHVSLFFKILYANLHHNITVCLTSPAADSGFVTSVSSVPTADSGIGITSISPKHSGKKLSCQVVHQAWRECYLSQPQYAEVKPAM